MQRCKLITPTPLSKYTMEPQRHRAHEGLRELGLAVKNYDCFDQEDVEFWHDEMEKMKVVDEELLALLERLPQRQQHLERIDEEYNLSQYFPSLMAKFSVKDAELQAIIDEKQKTLERHSEGL